MKDYVFKLIDRFTEGVDTYYNNGSMWLIFTDRKKWVIELTEDGTLWYNYYFFQDCFKYLSLDVFENQHYITEWVEDTIQNRVLNTLRRLQSLSAAVEDTIQNGVKHTEPGGYLGSIEMKGKIVHQLESPKQNEEVEDVIENGVKLTNSSLQIDGSCVVEDVIQNGIKETWGYSRQPQQRVNEIINGSIKETNWRKVDNHLTYLDNILKDKD
jgi:hypothetical protein